MNYRNLIWATVALLCVSCGCSRRLDVSYNYTVRPAPTDSITTEFDRLNVAEVLDNVTARHGMHETEHGPDNVIKVYMPNPSIGYILSAIDETNQISISMVGIEPRLKRTPARVKLINDLEDGMFKHFGERFYREP
jgi:hypothetical protein